MLQYYIVLILTMSTTTYTLVITLYCTFYVEPVCLKYNDIDVDIISM